MSHVHYMHSIIYNSVNEYTKWSHPSGKTITRHFSLALHTHTHTYMYMYINNYPHTINTIHSLCTVCIHYVYHIVAFLSLRFQLIKQRLLNHVFKSFEWGFNTRFEIETRFPCKIYNGMMYFWSRLFCIVRLMFPL